VCLGALGCAEATRMPTERVEIFRTEHGVPHLRAGDLEALGYGLAWVQMEDYGEEVLRRLLSSRGELARHLGESRLEDDIAGRLDHARAVVAYPSIPGDVRSVLEGFAAGVNAFVRAHPERVPAWAPSDFTGQDVAARDIGSWSRSRARAVLEAMSLPDSLVPGVPVAEAEELDPRDGSNAWALAPSRTASGAAILMRNPHLAWDAGYYEAHVTIPGDLDFYGDFRIGTAFGIVGGFNHRLGWSTTNNYPRLEQAYRLRVDPARPDRVLLGDGSIELEERVVEVEVRQDDGRLRRVRRRFWSTPLGPVIHRDATRVIVLHSAALEAPAPAAQFLRMMRATTLEAWKDAMRMRAMPSSNFTYADADGNILYVWNARLPEFPHEPADTALSADDRADVWAELLPWDALPRLENPRGGYVQNSNDPPHFTNLEAPLPHGALPPGVPGPRLRLRSQLSLRLLASLGDSVTLEEVIQAKHDVTMLAAERLKPDLVRAARAALAARRLPAGTDALTLGSAATVLDGWDGTAASDARGAVLFDRWMRRYEVLVDSASFWVTPWNAHHPTGTPHGVGDADVAVAALAEAARETIERWGALDVPWGDVHRARLGELDLPAPGCSNLLGCFRILEFHEAPDGRLEVYRGDSWVFAVEFTEPLRAYSILAYGETDDPTSPQHTSQLDMFLRGEMKPVLFDWSGIEPGALRRYRPGGR
jgi:acyl-homoserine-lactone acylase